MTTANTANTTRTKETGANSATTGEYAGRAESKLRAAARRRGLTLKQLAPLMGVSYGYLSMISSGHRRWTRQLREKAMEILGEVPGEGIVYRQGGLVPGEGESSYVRERAREMGMSMKELADRVGVSSSFMSQVSRGRRHLSPGAQARVEEALDSPVKVEPAQCPMVEPRVLWERMDAHDISQNEVSRRAGISSGYLSQIMRGRRKPSGKVLRRLHEVLFAPTSAELVAPVELKVMAWKKDGRNGVVVRGVGGPGGDSIRVGGRVPWGAEVEFAYTTGYDSRGRVRVNQLVDERGYGAMLTKPDAAVSTPSELQLRPSPSEFRGWGVS